MKLIHRQRYLNDDATKFARWQHPAVGLEVRFIMPSTACYGRPLSVSGRPCYILPMFFYLFFMAALFSGPGERRFAKVLHVVDLECH